MHDIRLISFSIFLYSANFLLDYVAGLYEVTVSCYTMYPLTGQIADVLCSAGFVNERDIVFIPDCYNLSLCKKVLFVLSKACLKR